jgi:putative DNA-invertase from lambdoid prophage Rac
MLVSLAHVQKAMGRPSALTGAQQAQALQRLAAGESVSQLARDYGTTRQSIMRLRNKAASA